MALPVIRPAGNARGATPPTCQRSDRRGEKATFTRSPGANAIRSPAWASASSYWIVGWTAPAGAIGRGRRWAVTSEDWVWAWTAAAGAVVATIAMVAARGRKPRRTAERPMDRRSGARDLVMGLVVPPGLGSGS